MGCPGLIFLGDNCTFSIRTHDADTGVVTNSDSVPSYRVYEDITETPILTGTMSLFDSANTTGLYIAQIACTTANGFENRKNYTISIDATVDSDTGGITYGFNVLNLTLSELTGDAGATPDALDALMRLYMEARNQITQTSTAKTLSNDAGTAIITKTVSDPNNTTLTVGEDTDVQ